MEELCDLAIEWFDGQADERRPHAPTPARASSLELGQPALGPLEALNSSRQRRSVSGFDHESVAVLLICRRPTDGLEIVGRRERFAAEGVAMAEQVSATRCGWPMR